MARGGVVVLAQDAGRELVPGGERMKLQILVTLDVPRTINLLQTPLQVHLNGQLSRAVLALIRSQSLHQGGANVHE